MKRTALFLLLASTALLAAGAARASAATAWTAKTDPALLAATAGGQPADFLVVLAAQGDLSGATRLADKTARGQHVYTTLATLAAQTQAPLRALLDAEGVAYRAYWVHNMLAVRGDRQMVQRLAARPEVAYVYANTAQRVALPAPQPDIRRAATGIEWNIDQLRAPQVWADGITGQGAVVGGQDTGYDWEHEAIRQRYRGWNGTTADHNYNWHDAIHGNNPSTGPGNICGFDSPTPCDDDGHGTHTMGTMVGTPPESEVKLGMAPGAKWIGCRNMEDGVGTPATYAECYEWFIAPYPYGGDPFTDGDPARAPHVINNSWSCPPEEGCTASDVLQAVVEAVRAAGILSVHSAGNAGPGCATITTPAAIYDASFTVGATDRDGQMAFLSSRGPVRIDGSDRIKPDVVAPGMEVRSSYPGNDYASLSGTSMAAPHVAGLAALLISADPALAGRVDVLEALIAENSVRLTSSQDCGNIGGGVPNNVYGWGRIDALAAYEAVPAATPRPFHMYFAAVPIR